MIILGIIGSQGYDLTKQATINVGQTVTVKDYQITYNDLRQKRSGENMIIYADLIVSKADQSIGNMTPQKVFYPTQKQPSTEVALYSTWLEDLYIILTGWEMDGTASLKILVNPLVKWIWTGGYVLILGTIFALWPGRGSSVGGKYTRRDSMVLNTGGVEKYES